MSRENLTHAERNLLGQKHREKYVWDMWVGKTRSISREIYYGGDVREIYPRCVCRKNPTHARRNSLWQRHRVKYAQGMWVRKTRLVLKKINYDESIGWNVLKAWVEKTQPILREIPYDNDIGQNMLKPQGMWVRKTQPPLDNICPFDAERDKLVIRWIKRHTPNPCNKSSKPCLYGGTNDRKYIMINHHRTHKCHMEPIMKEKGPGHPLPIRLHR